MFEVSSPFISFRQIDKTYDGEHYVVQGLNLDVARGEFISLLGPSGSGKTTTLMMLAGFESPTLGSILIDGQRLDDKPPHQRDIGMVFQNYALFPHLSIAQNIAFPLSVRNTPKGEQQARVKRALEMVELGHLANRRPAQLSGGQQQRVALARALVFEPKVVLMDEPLGALDKQLRETMQYEIMRLHRELGLTIVYVTHDQGEALTMSDRVAVFSEGYIQQLAPPTELYENPRNAFVANFVGENNGLHGQVADLSDHWATIVLADGTHVRGRRSDGLRPSGTGVLALRPERTHLGHEYTPDCNVLTAKVHKLIYCGDHYRVELGLPDGQQIVAKLPNDQHATRPVIGDSVIAHWRPEDCKVLHQPFETTP
ncbi:ABC transporter ATP-binding protein [Comamonas sp. Y33R10-2]|uniref:ABC transporter ATP-binding protein n=1 Tax=Comamonas sp. Y33R10-2 TaxID=2853257 RepID=UPI001C5CA4F8|nr:ABC transporter ATP-binding protein [Comamonas sp. Y33R10-2]QXZ08388.1 ABC transporter ATP-binding protein [Comamonas sp. Y33R10-2]